MASKIPPGVCKYTFSTKGLVFKKNFHCVTEEFRRQMRIHHLRLTGWTNFDASSRNDVHFIAIKNLKSYKGFDREK